MDELKDLRKQIDEAFSVMSEAMGRLDRLVKPYTTDEYLLADYKRWVRQMYDPMQIYDQNFGLMKHWSLYKRGIEAALDELERSAPVMFVSRQQGKSITDDTRMTVVIDAFEYEKLLRAAEVIRRTHAQKDDLPPLVGPTD